MKFEKKSAYFKNYYTRVNTGTKIKNNKVVYLFFSIFEATHWILFLSRRHPRRASASCPTSFFCLHIIFLRHHSKIRRQLQPKADKILFLKYRLRSNSLLVIRAKKKKKFQIFCSSEAKSSRHWRSGERYLNPCGSNNYSKQAHTPPQVALALK